ncbi:hypothetical protein ACFQ0M_45550 [Kitasatospora aburaviensis]
MTAFGAGLVQAGLRPGHRVANLFCAGELYGGFLYIENALHHAPVDNVRLPVAAAPDAYVAALIEDFGVDVLAGEPMKLSSVAEHLVKHGKAAERVELLLFGGDLLFADLRPILARAFPRAAVASIGYASVDAGLVGAPVPGDDVRVHEAFAHRTVVELVDDVTGEPVTAPGTAGRVVVTNLFRTLMPILRYPTGDRAEWIDGECRRFRLVGRSVEGARVGTVAMPTEEIRDVLVANDPDRAISGMQLVQRRWDGKDGLILRLGCTEEPRRGWGSGWSRRCTGPARSTPRRSPPARSTTSASSGCRAPGSPPTRAPASSSRSWTSARRPDRRTAGGGQPVCGLPASITLCPRNSATTLAAEFRTVTS